MPDWVRHHFDMFHHTSAHSFPKTADLCELKSHSVSYKMLEFAQKIGDSIGVKQFFFVFLNGNFSLELVRLGRGETVILLNENPFRICLSMLMIMLQVLELINILLNFSLVLSNRFGQWISWKTTVPLKWREGLQNFICMERGRIQSLNNRQKSKRIQKLVQLEYWNKCTQRKYCMLFRTFF